MRHPDELAALMHALAAQLPEGLHLVAVLVEPLEDSNVASISTFATLPPEDAKNALISVVTRQLSGEAAEPVKLGPLQ